LKIGCFTLDPLSQRLGQNHKGAPPPQIIDKNSPTGIGIRSEYFFWLKGEKQI